jgi:hypothetical protein
MSTVQQLHDAFDSLSVTVLRCKAERDELLVALKAALPNLHWANIHGSRCDEAIEMAEQAITKTERK